MITSPSRFVMSTAAGELMGDKTAAEDAICALCGGAILKGEPVKPTSTLGESFNNKMDAAVQSSRLICGACNYVSDRVWMERLSKCLVTEQGIFKLASNAAQAHFILNPPKPPFLAYLSTGKMQHVIWRAALTHTTDRINLRLGDRQLSWNPNRIRDLADDARTVLTVMQAAGIKGSSPFTKFDRELASVSSAEIRPDVVSACEANAAAMAAISRLEAMTQGELWAVGILLITKPDAIKEPEPAELP